MKTEKLKKLKDNCKLTTKQISDLSGIPESTISRILSGQTDNPTFDSVCAIVQAMGGSLDDLCDLQTDSDPADTSSLSALYERVIKYKNRMIRILFGFCCALVGVLVFIVLFDVLNGSAGFIRYS